MELKNGDAFELLKAMPDKSVDLVLSDPPYDFTKEQIDELHAQMVRVSKNGVITFSPPENPWKQEEANQIGFWIKPISTKNTSKRYSRFVEMIFFFGQLKWNADRHWSQYTNVFKDLVDGETEHPYEKPKSLIKRLMLNHSDSGDIILDPFMGSCTTGVVAKEVGREFIGFEKDPTYFKLATDRTRNTTSV